VPQPRLSPLVRAKLKARELTIVAHQPVRLFRAARRLALVPEPSDPWSVTLYAPSSGWLVDPVGYAERDTLEEAVLAALGGGDLLGAVRRLEREIEALTAVLRA